jgi:hypothetical protein
MSAVASAPSPAGAGLTGVAGAVRHRLPPALLAFLLYAGVAIIVFGRQAALHPGAVVIAPNEVDSSQYQWFLAWWPHAILHGLNPFITDLVYAPDGYNLTWTTSMAGPALLLSPVTLLFGASASFNLFALLAATLSPLAVFALCRHLTPAVLPALIAGLAFELSGYTLTAMQGDPWLAFTALLPLAALLALRRLTGDLSSRRFMLLLGAVIALQFLTAAEVLATATMFGALAIGLAALLLPPHRRELARLLRSIGAAFVVAALLLTPFLVFMLHPHPVPNQALTFARAPTDLTSLWIPGIDQARGPWQAAQWHRLGLPASGNGFAFIGLPLLLVVGAFAIWHRRRRSTWLLVALFGVAVIALAGVRLVLAGNDTGIPLPWALLRHLPLLRYALPLRLGVYPALLAAVILALWLSRTRTRWRWAVAALALLALVPSLSAPVWHSDTSDPRFFTDGTYHRYLQPGDNVLTIPAIGPNERWQERSGFAFRIVGGYLGAFPPSYTRYPAWGALLSGMPPPNWPVELRRYVTDKHVTAILIDERLGPRWPPLFGSLRARATHVDGVLILRLRPAR